MRRMVNFKFLSHGLLTPFIDAFGTPAPCRSLSRRLRRGPVAVLGVGGSGAQGYPAAHLRGADDGPAAEPGCPSEPRPCSGSPVISRRPLGGATRDAKRLIRVKLVQAGFFDQLGDALFAARLAARPSGGRAPPPSWPSGCGQRSQCARSGLLRHGRLYSPELPSEPGDLPAHRRSTGSAFRTSWT